MGSGQYLKAVIDTRAGIARVALRGELDMAAVPALEHHLEPFRNDGVPAVLLDPRGLTIIDSSGLHALVRGERARAGGHLLDDQDHIDALERFAQKRGRPIRREHRGS